MPDVTGGATRKQLTDLVKCTNGMENDFGVNYCYATVDVEGSGDVDNIGEPLVWSESDGAFIPFTVNPDWTASNSGVALGDVVKPTTQNGFEYVCVAVGSGVTHSSEPTWSLQAGVTLTETGGVQWLSRPAYSGNGVDSPLPGGEHCCVLVGTAAGAGVNTEDTTLSGTATEMTVIYRGPAALASDGFEWGSIAAVDQLEYKKALERQGLAITTSATAVVPTYV